jgi:hypothetical protein
MVQFRQTDALQDHRTRDSASEGALEQQIERAGPIMLQKSDCLRNISGLAVS